MIRLTDGVWIGDSADVRDVGVVGAGAVLNVARDLTGMVGWPNVEYAQVGLVDGPGNDVNDYVAALLVLAAMLQRHDCVLVYDHAGMRALAIGIMWVSLKGGRRPAHPSFQRRAGWDELLDELRGRCKCRVPTPDDAHREAYGRIPFGLLEALI